MDLNDYEDGDQEVEVDYEPYEEEDAPEGGDAHVDDAHVEGDLGLDLNLDQMNLGDEKLAAEPVAAPVVKPWEKALGIALRIPNPDEQRTMVDAAIAMRDASNRAEEEAKASRKHTSKKPPRSVALAPSKFTGQGKGQSFKVWCEGLKNYMDARGRIVARPLPLL